MTIEWLAGNRIRGTSTERTTTSGFSPTSAVSGGWKELGRTTLGSAGDDIDVTSLPDKRYYHILISQLPTGSAVGKLTLNNDSGSNYARRFSVNGASDTAQSSIAEIGLTTTETNPNFQSLYLANLSSKEKLGFLHNVRQNTPGAGDAPNRAEQAFKWANTSSAINRVDVYNSSTGDFNSGSEVVVLGYDPDDTHTDNFWTQLYSDSQTGQSTDNIDTGTFTNKKYLWVQLWVKGSANTTVKATFNNSTDSTYAYRWSNDGGADGSATSSANFVLHNTKANDDKFINMFIVNDGINEILGIAHTAEGNSDGAGNAPQRRETVFKRSTATAITDIEFDNDDTGDFTDWELKVWGSN